MRVLVTRAEPSASRTAGFLQKSGFEPVLLPLFEVSDTGNSIPDTGFDAYIFTSSNALKILEQRQYKPKNMNAVAFCVGDKTAAEAREFGFTEVVSADGNAEDLARLVENHGDTRSGEILYLAGVKRSFDMQSALARSGIKLQMAEIYNVISLKPSKQQVIDALNSLGHGFVLFYSQKTAEHVCKVIFEEIGPTSKINLSAIAISPKTADVVLKYPWQDVYVAREPTEQSMVKILNKLALP